MDAEMAAFFEQVDGEPSFRPEPWYNIIGDYTIVHFEPDPYDGRRCERNCW